MSEKKQNKETLNQNSIQQSPIKLSEIQDNPTLLSQVKVKSYVPIFQKQMLINGYYSDIEKEEVNGIVTDIIKEKDGMFQINYIELEINKVLLLVQLYAENIEFDEIKLDNITIYDFYIQCGLWDKVVNEIPKNEYGLFMDLLYKSLIQELEIRNNLGNVINKNLQRFINVIEKNTDPKALKSLSKSVVRDVNKLNWDKIPMVKEMYQTITGNLEEDNKNKGNNVKNIKDKNKDKKLN